MRRSVSEMRDASGGAFTLVLKDADEQCCLARKTIAICHPDYVNGVVPPQMIAESPHAPNFDENACIAGADHDALEPLPSPEPISSIRRPLEDPTTEEYQVPVRLLHGRRWHLPILQSQLQKGHRRRGAGGEAEPTSKQTPRSDRRSVCVLSPRHEKI
ncbi:hypothetical protein G7046_g5845 [Stylonectria norvegica]|nr:hypothetical protein G7046_g5845 [Stylonectria norvegica]